MAKSPSGSEGVAIGKFDILATYAYARARLDGADDDHARERGMVAAVMGARSRLGGRHGRGQADDFAAHKAAAEKKRKTTITAASFDRQVADKLGAFFASDFLPAITELVQTGLSYDDVKRVVKIPVTWGAKITGDQFRERVAAYRGRGGPGA